MVVLFIIIGMCFASFYMVVATRLTENKSIVKPGSHCDFCKHPLAWYDLIPVISFLSLGGKCRYCHKKMPISTLLIELILGFLFGLGYQLYGFSYELYAYLIIASLGAIIFISDFKYLVILDSPLIISIVLIFILKIVYFGFKTALFSLLSAVCLFAFMLLVKIVGDKVFKREALGWGDVKLSVFMGMVLGIRLGLSSLVLGSMIALPYAFYYIIKKEEKEIPYGPFLILGVFIIFIFMDVFNSFINFIFLID